MRYVVEHEGLYLKVHAQGWQRKRLWVPLEQASTWAKPGHAKQAANLAGTRLVTIWEVHTVLKASHGTHPAHKPR